ncbi:MAG: phosphatidate cytidylyltransferase, partial [Bacillota bacterium]
MLRTRVLTAVVILVLFVGMLFYAPANGWALFVLAIALAACWEWSRLCGFAPTAQSVYLLAAGALGGGFWMFYVRADDARFAAFALGFFAVAAAFWVLVAPTWLRSKWKPAALVAGLAGALVV